MNRTRITAAATIIATLVVASLTPVSAAAAGGGGASVIYSSLVSPLHGNMPSVGFEATSVSEFGNQVTFAGTNRQLANVVVTMSSWGCVSGHAGAPNIDCVTPTGATFNEPITFNIYNPPADGSIVPGALIWSVTPTFAIPYRPSASPKCVGADAGKWYDSSLKKCFNGFATNIQFNFPTVTLPNSVVFGIAYNTTDHGYAPIGQTLCNTSSGGCGYDSLNVALSDETVNLSAGTDPKQGTVFQNSTWSGAYCDYDKLTGVAAAGTGSFRLDSPTSACWTPLIPAVQFKAGGGKS